MKKVVAIDGPSGAGKSTVSKEIAKALGFQYLDTGALYRAVAYYFSIKFNYIDDFSLLTEQEIEEELKNIKIHYKNGRVFLSGEDVSDFIRDPKIGEITSQLSTQKVVRDFLMPLQRSFAEKVDIVAEGRDMTTVVFPDAWKKFYLDASPQVRAKRRFEQLIESGKKITFEEALRDVIERDKRDCSRENAPLRISKDAFYIDTSELTLQEVISIVLKKVAEDA
ncbi:(d)CMP kinase [Thermodesulfovibrio yellowstonii]|uniref:Cytidylate kinase n=1 Tax=Thermodesulfovibrio yellowstonii TaxID=28262 RepID=A0A9W6LJ57_9BACT|nr:(d)CMP kinase [Thermodesulfovibrio islandicus]GLI52861.1 cytidylate kinase [Thermodesulfovibrio islandicus]